MVRELAAVAQQDPRMNIYTTRSSQRTSLCSSTNLHVVALDPSISSMTQYEHMSGSSDSDLTSMEKAQRNLDMQGSPCVNTLKRRNRNGGFEMEMMDAFIDEFARRYGPNNPEFFRGSLEAAVDEVSSFNSKLNKPILVYLQHDGSELTSDFCRDTLCSPDLVKYLSKNYLLWGWDMTTGAHRQEFSRMAMEVLDIDTLTQLLMYGTDDYPVMLLLMRPGTILEVAQILKGHLTVEDLLLVLSGMRGTFDRAKGEADLEEALRLSASDADSLVLRENTDEDSLGDVPTSIPVPYESQYLSPHRNQPVAHVAPQRIEQPSSPPASTFQAMHDDFKPLFVPERSTPPTSTNPLIHVYENLKIEEEDLASSLPKTDISGLRSWGS